MKKIWIAIIAIVVLVGAAITYVATRDGDMPYEPRQQTTENQSKQPSTDTDDGQKQAAGQYTDYSEKAVANTAGRKWVFFHAPWCPQCRALEADILAKGVPGGLTIFKVDYDTSTELKQKYGVTLQTTIVEIDGNGNEIDKFVAYDDPTLGAVLNALGN